MSAVAMKPRRGPAWRRALAALIAVAGLVLSGQGLWIHAKAMLAQVLLERAFATSLEGGLAIRPWPWLDTWPVARIEVPRLGRSAIVLEGASGQALAFGPAHVTGTPEAGEPGTAIYAAHRDTQFGFLDRVRVGDEIEVTRRDGAVIRFRVTGTSVVAWNASGLDADAPGRNLVLSTCWPIHAVVPGPMRYLVHAEEMERSVSDQIVPR